MRNGIQRTLKSVGLEGCYLLCLLKFAQEASKKPVTIDDIENLMSKGLIRSDCFVKDPEGVLAYFGVEMERCESGGDLVIGYTGEHFNTITSIYGAFEPSVEKDRNYISYRRFKFR